MSSVFEQWTCVFPGKMGFSWKRVYGGDLNREEARTLAEQNCNVVEIPLQLWEKYRELEVRVMACERKLIELGLRADYREGTDQQHGEVVFVDLKPRGE